MASHSSKNENIDSYKMQNKVLPQKFNHMKNRVVLVKLDDYNPVNIENALKKVINLLNLKDRFKEKSILLKPNLLAPTKLAYTPPVLITELIKIIKGDANNILVGDSTMTKKLTSITFKRSNIKRDSEAEGARAINFFESQREGVKLENPLFDIEEKVYLPKEVVDADLIINLPKLKTHNGYVYTGAIKNFFGLLGNKMHMHMSHKNKKEFQQMLGDIYFAVEETNTTDFPKVLTIMDCVIAMEGNGPRAGKPRKVGLLIAGFNSAAVDIVGYTLMNGNPKDLEVINSIAKRTNLPVDILQLEIVGEENYKDYVVKDFKKPKVAILKKGQVPESGIFSKIANKAMSISIKIKQKKCLLCEQCVGHCPAQAMVRDKNKDIIIIDHDKCIECFCCGESCPNDAISAKWWIFRVAPYLIIIMAIGGLALIWLLIQFLSNLF